ncbi:MAG TPA: NAD(P)-dependent oxidoreductase [Bradyrhizobium sp.]|nr:NAD(P)-dependent oxidoreductase [Bradyrhizobium sp.]
MPDGFSSYEILPLVARLNWPRILITGAAGFIGGWTAEELCRAGATHVRAGVARTANVARIAGLPVETVHCDIMDPESLDAAMAGIEVVIHCAHSRIDESTTVEGTRLVLKHAITNGVRRVVHMSSVAVYGNVLGIVTEDTSPVPPVNPYGQRKQAAEQACHSAAGPQLTVAVVRPTLVYGPFGELWTTSYIKRILSGHLEQLGSAGEGNANLIYVRDLARFAAHLAVAELPQYSVFNANGPEIPTFNEYFDRLSRILGRGPLPVPTNSFTIQDALRRPIRRLGKYVLEHNQNMLKMANRNPILRDVLRRAEANLRLKPSDGEIRYYGTRVVFSALRAREVGFEPRVSLEEGLTASAEWARAIGLTG